MNVSVCRLVMADMAIRVVRFVAIDLGQGVTLVADQFVLLLVIVVVYASMWPARPERRFAACSPKMALVAI